jgi:hypothetical protein
MLKCIGVLKRNEGRLGGTVANNAADERKQISKENTGKIGRGAKFDKNSLAGREF